MWRKRTFWVLFALFVLIAQTPPSAAAQHDVLWQGQYYDNLYLSGTPTLTRQDYGINFNWGTGAPASGMRADAFSVRWAADVPFAAGTYRFYIQADDGVKLWVDFQLKLNTFDQPHPGDLLTVDVPLAGGAHHIQLDYVEHWGSAYVYFDWANLADSPAGPDFRQSGTPLTQPTPVTGLWTAEYFANETLSGPPAAIQVETSPGRDWGAGAPLAGLPADRFSARWTTTAYTAGGLYRFSLFADDGVRLIVDGRRVIDEFHSASGRVYTLDLPLATGLHTLVVEYCEMTGLANLSFDFRLAAAPLIPASSAPQAVATVSASVLNVRQRPDCSCPVLTRVERGQALPVIGRNADASWLQVNVSGVTGWVFARFTQIANALALPVTDHSAMPQYPLTGWQITALENAAIRAHPGASQAYLGLLPARAAAELVGRSAANTWWQISYGGVTGWVAASSALLPPGVDLNRVPVRS